MPSNAYPDRARDAEICWLPDPSCATGLPQIFTLLVSVLGLGWVEEGEEGKKGIARCRKVFGEEGTRD